MEKFLISLIGYAVGYYASIFLFGKSEGLTGIIPNFRFSFSGLNFSPHHWMFFVLLSILIMIIQSKTKAIPQELFIFIISIFLGGFVQGLSYKDWFIIIKGV